MLDLPLVIIAEVDVQAWIIVDFQDPCLEISINQQVESKDLKRFTLDVKLVSHSCDLRLNQGTIHLHSFSASSGYVLFDLIDINSHLSESLIKRLQGALGGVVVNENLLNIWADVVFIRLVDGVVGQVHESLLVVGLGWGLIASRAETSKTFVAKESLNRVKTRDYNVDSQIKLDAIDKQRVVYIPLCDDIVAL